MEKFRIPKITEEHSILKTIRIKITLYQKIEQLAIANNISINRLLNECIEYALNNLEDEAKEKVSN